MDYTIAPNTTAIGAGDGPPTTGTPGEFTGGNPATSTPATVLPAYQMNALVEEIIAVIKAANLTPDRTNTAQMLAAIKALISSDILVNHASGFTASTVLPTSDAHSIVFFTGNSAATFTLPAASAASAYSLPFVISNQGNASLSIAVPSGDSLEVVTAVLKPGQVCALINDGDTTWHHLWQESVTIGDFSSSFSSTDYLLLPNGFMMQWVQGSLPASGGTTSSATVALKTAFPNFSLGAWASLNGSANSTYGYSTGCQAHCPDTGHIFVNADTLTGNSGSAVNFNQAVPFTAYAIGR